VLLDAVVKIAKTHGYHGDVDQAARILHVEGTFAASRLAVSVALQEAVCAPCEPAFRVQAPELSQGDRALALGPRHAPPSPESQPESNVLPRGPASWHGRGIKYVVRPTS
jgi:hypothetical protein